MTGYRAFREAAKICRQHARDYNSLSSDISREPLKKWINKANRARCAAEFAGIAVELYCVSQEMDGMADKLRRRAKEPRP